MDVLRQAVEDGAVAVPRPSGASPRPAGRSTGRWRPWAPSRGRPTRMVPPRPERITGGIRGEGTAPTRRRESVYFPNRLGSRCEPTLGCPVMALSQGREPPLPLLPTRRVARSPGPWRSSATAGRSWCCGTASRASAASTRSAGTSTSPARCWPTGSGGSSSTACWRSASTRSGPTATSTGSPRWAASCRRSWWRSCAGATTTSPARRARPRCSSTSPAATSCARASTAPRAARRSPRPRSPPDPVPPRSAAARRGGCRDDERTAPCPTSMTSCSTTFSGRRWSD